SADKLSRQRRDICVQRVKLRGERRLWFRRRVQLGRRVLIWRSGQDDRPDPGCDHRWLVRPEPADLQRGQPGPAAPQLSPGAMRSRSRQQSALTNPVLVGAVTVLAILVAVFLAYNANAGLPFVPTKQLKVDIGDGSN